MNSLRGILRSGEPRRFLISGALNTLVTYGLYLCLVAFMPYATAYSVSYGAGVLLSFVLNSLYVFRQKLKWEGVIRYPLVYVGQYLLGIAVLSVCLVIGRFPQWLASAAAVGISVPLTFVLSRWALGAGASSSTSSSHYNPPRVD
jgi:putative flippase GtrA